MRAAALLGVLILAKAAVVWGRPFSGGGWWPIALVWQDVAFALGCALLDRLFRRPKAGWPIYGGIAVYATLNVPVMRAISSPLTWPMLRATDSALWDSIVLYCTATNLLLVAALLLTAGFLPILLSRIRLPKPLVPTLVALAVVVVGPFAARFVDSAGLDRNVVAALVTTAFPRVAARPHDVGDWRTSRFEQPQVDELSDLRGAAAGSNVLFVVLESAAAQYLRIYGAAEDPMPNLTRLADRGVTFANAYVVYPESIKGLYALLCSRFPAFDTSPEDYEAIGVPALPAVLRGAGYRTALFHSGRFAYLGMDAIVRRGGFETREDASQISGNFESSFGVDEEATVTRLLDWIDRQAKGRPFFAAYLPVAGHHPYDTPRRGPFDEREEIGRYRNALHYADQALGQLIAGLGQRGLDGNTVIVVCGDHGQAFHQHPGNYGHTLFLYEENIHVPLVIALPGQRPPRTSRTVASTIDVAPTLLDVLGLRAPQEYEGQSLLSPRPAISLFFTDYSLPLVGLRDGRWKFIDEVEGGSAKLFDLARDPGETVNLARDHAGRVAAYDERLRMWSESVRARFVAHR
ncbi:MAG TPA: sulfatase [Pirellulales bacterium]|nr:sulfatase [Pirellulales bacterium]